MSKRNLAGNWCGESRRLTVRLSRREWQALDELCTAWNIERSEALWAHASYAQGWGSRSGLMLPMLFESEARFAIARKLARRTARRIGGLSEFLDPGRG